MSELLTEILDGANPFRTPDAQEPTVRHLLDVGAERMSRDLSGQDEVRAEVSTVIGRVYLRLGLYDKAQPLLEQSLELGRQTVGPEHVSIAQTLNDLGVLHRERGNVAAAQPLLEESLAMRRHLLGSVDKDVAVTLVELARVLRDRGLDAKAEPLAARGAGDPPPGVRRGAPRDRHQPERAGAAAVRARRISTARSRCSGKTSRPTSRCSAPIIPAWLSRWATWRWCSTPRVTRRGRKNSIARIWRSCASPSENRIRPTRRR